MTCRDLGEVMQLFERYYHVLAPDLELEFHATARAGPHRIDRELCADLPLQFGLECIAAAMRNTLRGLLGTERGPPCVSSSPIRAPAHARRATAEVLGDDVHFDCPAASWSFPAALLTTPSCRVPIRPCASSTRPSARACSRPDGHRRISPPRPAACCANSRVSIRKCPRSRAMLNVSPRTYRRRLAEQGTSFQELLDRCARSTRRDTCARDRLPIASIAYQLGFSDPSNFRRAYRALDRPDTPRRRCAPSAAPVHASNGST
jgi:hypothetical protein